MKNINELIGFVKGISYDNVINEKEIQTLTNWVAVNRNIAVGKEEAELISLLEEILEDNTIDDDEKESLLKFCENYIQGREESLVISELNGIIQGITCDNVINEAEVSRLKSWMDNNQEIRSFNEYNKIFSLVENILEDGVVSEEEQAELFESIRDILSKAKIRTHIKHLKEKVRSLDNIGIELIESIDDESTIEYIHRLAETQLKRALSKYTGALFNDKEIVFISLVLIGLMKYDSNYWSYVQETYPSLYKAHKGIDVNAFIRDRIIKVYRKKEASSKTIISTVLENAIVPLPFLPHFFDFIFDIYRINFKCSLPDDGLEEDFRYIYNGLKPKVSLEDDFMSFDFAHRTYKLVQSTKHVLMDPDQCDALIRLSIIVIKLIDKKITKQPFCIYNPYLKYGFENWERDNSEYIQECITGSKNRVKRGKKAELVYRDGEVYIYIPAFRIKYQYDYRNISVEVSNSDRILYKEDNPEIEAIYGGYELQEQYIKLHSPLGQVKYSIKCGKTILFESGKRLYRDIICFNESGSEIKNNTDYTGVATFCYNENNKMISRFINTKEYAIGYIEVSVGDSVVFNNFIFNFTSIAKPGVFGKRVEKCFLIDDVTKNVIPVFYHIDNLIFEDTETSSEYIIQLDQESINIGDFQYKVIERAGVRKYVIPLMNLEDGIHTATVYRVDDKKKHKILSCEYAIDSEYEISIKTIDYSTFAVEFLSSLMELSDEKIIDLNNYDPETEFQFIQNGKRINYCIPLPLNAVKIDENGWKSFYKSLWIKDITADSVMKITDTICKQVMVLGSDGACLEILPVSEKMCFSECKIGSIISHKMNHDFISLIFVNEEHVYAAMRCYNKCCINQKVTRAYYDSVAGHIRVEVDYSGVGNVYFQVSSEDEVVFKSGFIHNKDSIEADFPVESKKNYTISFYEKPKALSINKNRLLYEMNESFFVFKDLIGKSFEIDSFDYEIYKQDSFVTRTIRNPRCHVLFEKKLEENVYEGRVFKEVLHGMLKTSTIKIVIENNQDDSLVEVSFETKLGDLIYNKKKFFFEEEMQDEYAVPVISCKIRV